MNRRGYVFATADRGKLDDLASMAASAEARGGGASRFHEAAGRSYLPSPERGYAFDLAGADVITHPELIRRHFPCLAPEAVALVSGAREAMLRFEDDILSPLDPSERSTLHSLLKKVTDELPPLPER